MAGHSEGVGSRQDIGNRVFVGWVFVPVGMSLVMNALAFGQTGNLLVVGWGLFTLVVLLTLANALHSGSRRAERMTLIVAAVFLLLGVGEFVFAWGTAAAFHIVFQCLMPLLLAFMLTATPVRYFLAFQRGDSVEKFTKDLSSAAYSLPRIVYIVCCLLLALAAVNTFYTVELLVPIGHGATMLLVGLLGIPAAAVMFILARNWRFFAGTGADDPGYRKIVINDAQTLFNCLAALTSLLAVIALVDLM